MKNSLFLILILSTFLFSCNKLKETDQSLMPEEYQKLGMPDYMRIWSMEDYSNAFFALNTLKYENPKALPAKESKKSGELFARMISMENLSFLQDETLPLWARADMIKWFVNTLMELKVAYTLVGMERQYYVRELMDIDIFRVSVAQKMLELGRKINESEDPSDVVMQADYPHIQIMYLDVLAELLEQQQHTSLYPEQTLELLADSLSASVRRNMDWFDEDASALVKQAMLTVVDLTSSRKIKSDYRELTEIL
jgi:hypothetical protein